MSRVGADLVFGSRCCLPPANAASRARGFGLAHHGYGFGSVGHARGPASLRVPADHRGRPPERRRSKFAAVSGDAPCGGRMAPCRGQTQGCANERGLVVERRGRFGPGSETAVSAESMIRGNLNGWFRPGAERARFWVSGRHAGVLLPDPSALYACWLGEWAWLHQGGHSPAKRRRRSDFRAGRRRIPGSKSGRASRGRPRVIHVALGSRPADFWFGALAGFGAALILS